MKNLIKSSAVLLIGTSFMGLAFAASVLPKACTKSNVYELAAGWGCSATNTPTNLPRIMSYKYAPAGTTPPPQPNTPVCDTSKGDKYSVTMTGSCTLDSKGNYMWLPDLTTNNFKPLS